jgi:hypothetical protein
MTETPILTCMEFVSVSYSDSLKMEGKPICRGQNTLPSLGMNGHGIQSRDLSRDVLVPSLQFSGLGYVRTLSIKCSEQFRIK